MTHRTCLAISIVVMFLAALTITAEESAVQLLNPVAMVNGFIVTPQDLNYEVEQLRWEMDIRNLQLTDQQLDKLRPQVIENLINRELLYQNAQEKNYQIRSQWIDREVAGLKQRLKNSASLETYLKQINMDMAQLKERIKKGLIIRRLIHRDLLQKVRVSESEIQAFYRNYPEFFRQEEQVRARHILVKVTDMNSDEQRETALAKIRALQARLEQGADFSVLALEYSDCPSKNRGGDVGYFTRNQMVAAFSEAAFNLQPGQISDIVATHYGFHLIQLIDRKPPSQIAYKNMRGKIERTLRRNKEQQKIDTYLAGLKRKADIKIY